MSRSKYEAWVTCEGGRAVVTMRRGSEVLGRITGECAEALEWLLEERVRQSRRLRWAARAACRRLRAERDQHRARADRAEAAIERVRAARAEFADARDCYAEHDDEDNRDLAGVYSTLLTILDRALDGAP
jgi:hypothetical protein